MRKLFSTKELVDLIFDEHPYKVYKVKLASAPNFTTICFDDESNVESRVISQDELYGSGYLANFNRIYKGEAVLNFIAYNPYAKSRYKYIDDYTVINLPEWKETSASLKYGVQANINEWRDASGILLKNSKYDTNHTLDVLANDGVAYYNPGDIDCPFILDFKRTNSSGVMNININD